MSVMDRDYDLMIPRELKNRRNPLIFAEKDVERDNIEVIVEAARSAPSCFNNRS